MPISDQLAEISVVAHVGVPAAGVAAAVLVVVDGNAGDEQLFCPLAISIPPLGTPHPVPAPLFR